MLLLLFTTYRCRLPLFQLQRWPMASSHLWSQLLRVVVAKWFEKYTKASGPSCMMLSERMRELACK